MWCQMMVSGQGFGTKGIVIVDPTCSAHGWSVQAAMFLGLEETRLNMKVIGRRNGQQGGMGVGGVAACRSRYAPTPTHDGRNVSLGSPVFADGEVS